MPDLVSACVAHHRPSVRGGALLGAAIVLLFVAGGSGIVPWAAAQETSLSNEERAKLDTFEGVLIDKADKVFAAQEWRQAVAEYDAFILQFPESKVTSYAILRKGRGLQQALKRFEAIKVYEEVLDFFPDDVKYAAAALFRIGQCHMQNGDVPKAMKAWLELAEDADYVKEPLGAPALNGLAENLIKQGKLDEGIARYEQVAVKFRTSNPDAARAAIGRVVPYHIRTKPDARKLREFYVAARSFEGNPRGPGDDLDTDALYWQRVYQAVAANGQFNSLQRDERIAYFRYWAEQLAGKFPADDQYQIALAGFYRSYEEDDAAWVRRMDKQFADYQKEGDFARTIAWMKLYTGRQDKIEEYLLKLDFARLPVPVIMDLVRHFIGTGNLLLANNTFDKLPLNELDDGTLAGIGGWGTRDMVRRACEAFKDQDGGRMHWLRWLHGKSAFAESVPLANEMKKVPAYVDEANMIMAQGLHNLGKFEEAIACYRQAAASPQIAYAVSDCLAKLGRLEPAVSELREVEVTFQSLAPDAALRIAYLYRDAGMREKYVRSLRGVLKKYPKSGQSSQAHLRLEEMGLPIGGGVDAEE